MNINSFLVSILIGEFIPTRHYKTINSCKTQLSQVKKNVSAVDKIFARNTGRGWNFLSLGSDPSILQSLSLSLGLSEGHPEHPPSPFSFTL